jgi:hypothetical protein
MTPHSSPLAANAADTPPGLGAKRGGQGDEPGSEELQRAYCTFQLFFFSAALSVSDSRWGLDLTCFTSQETGNGTGGVASTSIGHWALPTESQSSARGCPGTHGRAMSFSQVLWCLSDQTLQHVACSCASAPTCTRC